VDGAKQRLRAQGAEAHDAGRDQHGAGRVQRPARERVNGRAIGEELRDAHERGDREKRQRDVEHDGVHGCLDRINRGPASRM